MKTTSIGLWMVSLLTATTMLAFSTEYINYVQNFFMGAITFINNMPVA